MNEEDKEKKKFLSHQIGTLGLSCSYFFSLGHTEEDNFLNDYQLSCFFIFKGNSIGHVQMLLKTHSKSLQEKIGARTMMLDFALHLFVFSSLLVFLSSFIVWISHRWL